MTHQATSISATPIWSANECADITGDLFLDLDPDGAAQIFAHYHTVVSNYGGHYFNRDVETTAILDGIRIVHDDGLTEWRDREWLMNHDSRDAYAAEGFIEMEMGA